MVQSIQKFMYIPDIQKDIQKIYFDLEIIAFDLVSLDTRFYLERILVIGYQYDNKYSQDFRYYYDRVVRADLLSE